MFKGRLHNTLVSFNKVYECKRGSVLATTDLTTLTKSDFDKIATDYFNRYKYNILPPCKKKCMVVIEDTISNGGVGIVIKKDNEAVGMLLAEESPSAIVDGRILRQSFFNTILEGISAARAVSASHSVLLEYAADLRYDYVCSNGSNKDTKNNFNRILSIDGWYTEHYMSVWTINRRS